MYKHYEPQDSTNFQQRVDIQYLVLLQIQKCSTSAYESDEISFSNAVESLLAMLPKENRLRIESDKVKDSYVTKVEQPVYKYSCGKPMGTLENPIFRNNKSDWNYQGGDPILVSPTVEEVEQTDYQKLYKIVMGELELIGATWKTEPRDRIGKRIKQPPTPLITLKDGSQVRILIQKEVPPEIALLQQEAKSSEADNDNSNEDDEEMDVDEDVQ